MGSSLLNDYERLKNDEQLKEKAKRELGLDVPTGQKESTGRKKGDGTEKTKDVMVCNWLLHFLNTFHYYRKENKLELFTSILQLKRYDFGNQYFMREEIQNVYKQIGFVGDQLGMVYDILAGKEGINEHIGEIKDFMATAHNVRQEVSDLKAAVNDVENYAKKVANDANANLQMLQNQIQSQMRIDSKGSSDQLSNLASRISSLESSISKLASGVGGGTAGSGSAGISASEYNSKVEKIDKLNAVISRLINAVHSGEKNLNSYINEVNAILGS